MCATPNCSFFAAGKIHNPFHFVRDFYFFKRSQYPQLSLVHKKPAEAYLELQEQAFKLKFAEMGKVMLIWGILKNVRQGEREDPSITITVLII